jgi:hypothetical protein
VQKGSVTDAQDGMDDDFYEMCFVEQLLGNLPPELLIAKDIASYLG